MTTPTILDFAASHGFDATACSKTGAVHIVVPVLLADGRMGVDIEVVTTMSAARAALGY